MPCAASRASSPSASNRDSGVSTELTAELRDTVVAGCEREADSRSIDDLVAVRDRGVIAILRALDRL
jgi:hypothetical protein